MSILFWVLMLLWLLFGVWVNWPNYKATGFHVILFLLLLLLGWAVFGRPVQ